MLPNRHKEKGQAILEMAIILPVFVLVGLGLVDMELLTERAANLNYIVSETARCMAINGQACNGATSANTPVGYAKRLAAGLNMDADALVVDEADCSDLGVCTVKAEYPFHPIGAWFPKVQLVRIGIAAK